MKMSTVHDCINHWGWTLYLLCMWPISIIVNIKACLFLPPIGICMYWCMYSWHPPIVLCIFASATPVCVCLRVYLCVYWSVLVRVCVFVLMTKHRTLGPRAKRNETLCGISSRDFEEEPAAAGRTGQTANGERRAEKALRPNTSVCDCDYDDDGGSWNILLPPGDAKKNLW